MAAKDRNAFGRWLWSEHTLRDRTGTYKNCRYSELSDRNGRRASCVSYRLYRVRKVPSAFLPWRMSGMASVCYDREHKVPYFRLNRTSSRKTGITMSRQFVDQPRKSLEYLNTYTWKSIWVLYYAAVAHIEDDRAYWHRCRRSNKLNICNKLMTQAPRWIEINKINARKSATERDYALESGSLPQI